MGKQNTVSIFPRVNSALLRLYNIQHMPWYIVACFDHMTKILDKDPTVDRDRYVQYSCSLRRMNVMPIEIKRNRDQKDLSPLP